MKDVIGWDLGGAHVKAAWVHEGNVEAVWQVPCPLWRGIERLGEAVSVIARQIPSSCVHGVTMTGEMVDAFPDRQQGGRAILERMGKLLPEADLRIFENPEFIPLSFGNFQIKKTASQNWILPALWIAHSCQTCIFIDIGSTTTDIVPIQQKHVVSKGLNDRERLESEELLYMGVIRTPLMALAEQVPFGGKWHPLMAEHFATSADIYRILALLPPHADQAETADGGPKTAPASMRRLARMIGCDKNDAAESAWSRLAEYFMELQIQRLMLAIMRQLSTIPEDPIELVGAGVGQFLLPEIARRLAVPYRDFSEFIPRSGEKGPFSPADCAPAVALALLLELRLRE